MTKPAFKPKQILWVDMEMTGLDPVADYPLEIAAIVTDWDFTVLATYEGVVHWPTEYLTERFEHSKAFWHNEAADAMAGLLKQNDKSSKTCADIEQEVIAFARQHCATDAKVLLAGNSIHQDRKFIDQWWPELSKILHYRMLDVSAWKVVFEGKFKKSFKKAEEHRALEDIKGSIEELKYYLKSVQKG